MIRVLEKFFLKLLGIHSSICLHIRNGKRSLSSLERKQIYVVNKRLYVPSLTPKHTHTSATSKPSLKQLTAENSWLATDILWEHREPPCFPYESSSLVWLLFHAIMFLALGSRYSTNAINASYVGKPV